MNFENFNSILEKIFKSKKKATNIQKMISNMIKTKEIDEIFSLFILKVTIIILSYYPEKEKLIYRLFETFYKSKLESRKFLLINLSKMTKDNFYSDYDIDDEIMDKVIFITLELVERCDKIGKNGLNLFITILNEIIINIKKIKLEDINLKSKIYLMFIRKSNKLVKESLLKKNKGQIYFKIMEMCGVTTRIINSYIK